MVVWLQSGLAKKPATAYFLTPPERDWLVERQATVLAARKKEDAFAGSMWGVFHEAVVPAVKLIMKLALAVFPAVFPATISALS